MGLFDKLMNKVEKEHIDVDTEKNTLYLPIEGEVIAVSLHISRRSFSSISIFLPANIEQSEI